MASKALLIDTNILSAIIKQETPVLTRAHAYLQEHNTFTFSVINQYEIFRGLHAKGAEKQISAFKDFCQASIILSVTEEVALQAARIYADLKLRGEIIEDADILIGATALIHGYGVATHNGKHFSKIPNLYIENWKK